MRAAKKITVDRKLLQELVPLNALSAERFREVAEKIVIEEVLEGHYLFRKGDRDNQSIYLLEGKVNLVDGFRKVTSVVEAGSDISRYPIANLQPRSLSARAVKKVIIARVDSGLLDVFLTWDQSSTAEVVEIDAETNKDWMTRMLQSDAFIKIPPSMIQSLLIKMEPLQVEAGTAIIRQGDSGDYFYTIHDGRCAVTRQDSPDGEEQVLAELGEGDCFGEDALVSDARRNATVTMLTDGLLMRLAKQDFVELLKNQLVKRVDYEQAVAMVDDGAVWVDVRTADEYENGAFEDSVNIPLFRLRDELSELVYNSKYIICCDTGRRSESAGFLLSHKGFDVYVLEGGISGHANNAVEYMGREEASASDEVLAEVIDFDGELHEYAGESDPDTGIMSVAQDEPAVSETAADLLPRHEAEAIGSHLEQLRAENEVLNTQLQAYRTTEERMTEQLELLRGELGESGEKLGALYAQAKIDAEQLELLRGELGESGEKLGAFYAQETDAANEKQLQQEQYHALQEEFSGRASAYEQEIGQLQEQLTEMQTRIETRSGEYQVLQRDNEILRTELRDSGALQDEYSEQLENLLADKQASEEALQRQQTEWDIEQTAVQQALESEQQNVTALREELTLAELQSSEDRSALEAELKVQLDKANEKLEQLESNRSELEQDSSRQADELHAVISEREQLQQHQTEVEAQNQHLESEIASLRLEMESLVAASNEQQQQLQIQLQEAQAHNNTHEQLTAGKDTQINDLQEQLARHEEARAAIMQEQEQLQQQLQVQLQEVQEKTRSAEQSNEEKDARIHSLQEQLAQHGAEAEAIQQERELTQQQMNELRLQLEQQEERAKALDEEHKASVQKAHEDLMRKNDNEKELQGQIDRLRKKLEQQTTDHKQDHDSAREDVDNLRDQLHAERQARAEERSEMGARQRELKEQLALIAAEHETKLTNQDGAIEQARDAVRREEQERVRELLAAHVETEDQVNRLQQELNKAHEEIAELARQEKDRRKVDVGMMEEQNQQALATISQLESQLKQYMEERDAALDEQQSLRERMNALRGEVEVARGLMGVSDQVEDPAKLRHELNESKKNIGIALRLRAEAEAARAHLQEERDALRQQLDSSEMESEPLHVPSLDKVITASGHPGPEQINQQAALAVTSLERERDDEPQSLVDGKRDDRQRRWPGAAIGLCAVVACVLAGWIFFGTELPVTGDNVLRQAPVAAEPELEAEAVTAVGSDSPAAEVQQAVLPDEEEIETPATTVEDVAPDLEPAMPQPDPRVDEVVHAEQQAPVIAGRSFRESLRIGGQGPVMVELPAGSYEMGSSGNSLNFDEGPRHQVSLSAFSVSKFEVTFAEYDRFARASGRRLPYDESWGRGKRPVINVSWEDARAYARWLSKQTGNTYRLPTEAEWEYVARAGVHTSFWWDDRDDILHANCFNCGSEWDSKRTAPVGSFGANDFGLHDVAGNVQEWTADCYHGSYHGAPADGSAWQFPECVMRVVRGGAYTSPLDSLRSAKRSQYDQDTRLDNIGFRVVREH
ncbi:MAG: SUMF1/EgtB/PvdO family nonheme iron enzyme [Gammaproteobacteria bacterium]